MTSFKKPLFSNFPWILFLIFFLSNLVLSYAPMGLEAKLWTALLGLLLPFGLALLRRSSQPDINPLLKKEFLPPISPGVWVLLAAAAAFIRFDKLTTLSVWPLYDEGMYGYYASEILRGLDWKWFYGSSQAPPLYLWLLAGIFKVLGTSLFSLWLLPALLSAFLLIAGYWAARGLFSRSYSFLCACLLGFSFWPFYVGHFSLMTGLVLLAECLVLGLLARFCAAPPLSVSVKQTMFLGLATGLGFYTYLHWPVLAVAIFLTFLFWAFKRRKKERVPLFLSFLGGGLAAVLPLVWGLEQGSGAGQLLFYLRHLSAGQSPSWGDQVGISLSYVASLFWGMDLGYHTYQPVWGGYLNPVLGAFFFLGLLETLRRLRKPLFLWLFLGLLLFILPGALTSERATSRMILVFPVLVILVSIGASWLLSLGRRGKIGLLGLGLLSLALDLYHMDGAYPKIWKSLDNWTGYEKSYARYQAYLELKKIHHEKGPGFVFGDFVPGLADQTLAVAVYDFNAAQNPNIPPDQAVWAAALINVNYQPFLKKRFPDGKAYWVSKNLNSPDGGWMLWIFPANASNRGVIRHWQSASKSLGSFIEKNLCYIPGGSFNELSQSLQKAYPSFQNDPLLESCFWEKMADTASKEVLRLNNMTDGASVIQCFSTALQKGYPAANLYRDMAVFEWMRKDTRSARRYFKKAVQAPLDFTDAGSYLKMMDSKGGKTPEEISK